MRAIFTKQQFRLTFDTYLCRLHDFGPLRTKRQHDRAVAGLLGYNRDSTWQLPALCSLLPAHPTIINHQGEGEFNGLHFQDDLLTLFPTIAVTLRSSEHSAATVWIDLDGEIARQLFVRDASIQAATAWIDLDGEILCEVKARELRRPDGTYRSRRPSGRSRLTN